MGRLEEWKHETAGSQKKAEYLQAIRSLMEDKENIYYEKLEYFSKNRSMQILIPKVQKSTKYERVSLIINDI